MPVIHRSQALLLADRRPPARLGRRRPRQDHLDRHDRDRPAGARRRSRPSSTAASSRSSASRAAPDRTTSSSSRPTSPTARSCSTTRRSRSSRTSTPTTSTTTARDDAFHDAFATFANRAREAVVISADDAGARAVTERLTHPNVVTFGESDAAHVRVSDIRTDGPVSFTRHPRRGRPSTRGCRCPARTTRSTRPAPSRCCSPSGTSSSRPSARSRASRAPCAGSSCTASSAA